MAPALPRARGSSKRSAASWICWRRRLSRSRCRYACRCTASDTSLSRVAKFALLCVAGSLLSHSLVLLGCFQFFLTRAWCMALQEKMKSGGQDATLNMSYSEIIGPGHTMEDPSFNTGGSCSSLCREHSYLR